MSDEHKMAYKNNGKTEDEMRRHRSDITVQLRKNKRQETLEKHRALPHFEISRDDGEEAKQLPLNLYLKKLQDQVENLSFPDQQIAAVREIHKLVRSRNSPTVRDLTKSGVISMVVNCLTQHHLAALQFEAVCTLNSIVSGTSEDTHCVVGAGAVPLLVQLLTSPIAEVCERSVWTLGNIIGDGAELRDYVIQHGAIQPMLLLINPSTSLSVLRITSWTISNLCRNNDQPLTTQILSRILPALNMLMSHGDAEILVYAAWTASYLAEGGILQIQMLVESGVLPKIVHFLDHPELRVLIPTLHAVGHIASGTEEQTRVLLDHRLLSYIAALMVRGNENVCQQLLWILAKITAGSHSFVQAVIDVGLLPVIIQFLHTGNLQLQKEAAFAICNITINGSLQQVSSLANVNIIGPLVNLLTCQDTKIIIEILNGLNSMLNKAGENFEVVANLIEESNGIGKIEDLQGSPNIYIYKMVYEILEKYFSDKHNKRSCHRYEF